ncbi:MAG: hypothetical protein COU11_02775 [Candidatus Harrisonbacteria bacterium CG10_big_fil_rev_8_21_14_0_10_49_15]|uniref:Uncharacterized protein n=1 Tax=Candidatus Harrisonbacteria bacterium CG10_big_fil_rev_8_21_14_0_10_49_15 TaxID=1974587 RepID=A0A2H0UN82_9BACT|nr:MAG: hypothetical protein COU11_02775 [Candidatus Harrisonbacteria bacterium CG10_big_fil_rev_8_21_14_0_10_49_15]
MLLLDKLSRNLLFVSDKDRVKIVSPQEISLVRVRPMFWGFFFVLPIFIFLFLVPDIFSIIEGAWFYRVFSIVLLLLTVFFQLRKSDWVKIVFKDELSTELKTAYFAPSKHLGAENDALGNKVLSLGGARNLLVASRLSEVLNDYYFNDNHSGIYQIANKIPAFDEEKMVFLGKQWCWAGFLGFVYYLANRNSAAAIANLFPGYSTWLPMVAVSNGRRVVWQSGVWNGDWQAFKKRQKVLEVVGVIYMSLIALALIVFFSFAIMA